MVHEFTVRAVAVLSQKVRVDGLRNKSCGAVSKGKKRTSDMVTPKFADIIWGFVGIIGVIECPWISFVKAASVAKCRAVSRYPAKAIGILLAFR